jgi:methionine-rich copper-binding protein CopC
MKIYSSKKTLLSIAFLILSTSPLPAFSHAIMVKSQPEENATLTVSPKQIDVWFNDKVGSEYKALAVIDSTGARVDNKDVQQELLDASHVYCTIPTLPAGTYTIRYRVVSIDTHIVTGKFQFTIKAP